MEQIKTFKGEDAEELDNEVNAWLEENEKNIVIKDRLICSNKYGVYMTYCYIILE